MPQASDEDRAKMAEYFGGDGIDDGPPARYLISQGWTCQPGFVWRPTFTDRAITSKEFDCVFFLCDEWDYGCDIPPSVVRDDRTDSKDSANHMKGEA